MFYAWLYFFIEILALYSVYKAIMETRTAQGAIAWAVFLITFPLLALPAYWILGRNRFMGYTSAKAAKDETIHQKLSYLRTRFEHLTYHPQKYEIDVIKTSIATFPPLLGNDTRLLINGEATFKSILDGLQRAKSYILFQFYIVEDGELANQIQNILIQKAKGGIRIYFLYDEIGSYTLSSAYLQKLKDAGVETSPFMSSKGWKSRFQLNFRNHRKSVVVDGLECWIGGHNVADEYIDGGEFGFWRDTHVHITGPAVIPTQISFIEDWYWATGKFIEELFWEAQKSAKNLPVFILPTGPADKLDTAVLAFVHFINGAKERIWIATPYFVPDDATMIALQLASLHGVDVRILIPDHPDHLLVYFTTYSYFEDVQKTGVKFYRYTDGFMHQKVMLVDNDIAIITTANFDNRSFRLNFEMSAVIYDTSFAKEVESMLKRDLEDSKEMYLEEVRQKPLWFRFASKVARLASPIL